MVIHDSYFSYFYKNNIKIFYKIIFRARAGHSSELDKNYEKKVINEMKMFKNCKFIGIDDMTGKM